MAHRARRTASVNVHNGNAFKFKLPPFSLSSATLMRRKPQAVTSSLPFAVVVYYNYYFVWLYFLVSCFTFIYKGTVPYPNLRCSIAFKRRSLPKRDVPPYLLTVSSFMLCQILCSLTQAACSDGRSRQLFSCGLSTCRGSRSEKRATKHERSCRWYLCFFHFVLCFACPFLFR